MLLFSSDRTPFEPWHYRFYAPIVGRNDFAKWNSRLSAKARANRDVKMRFLKVQPLSRWTRPTASPLGKHLYVIHFQDENGSAHRLCGFVSIEHHAFVICVTITEKDGKYNPTDYEARTLQAKNHVDGAFNERTNKWPWGSL
jgi:hypothetical protein